MYVDDFKMSGPSANVDRAWVHIRQSGLEIGPTQKGDDVYLGCSHEKRKITVDNREYQALFYNVQSNIEKIVEKVRVFLNEVHRRKDEVVALRSGRDASFSS